MGMLKYLPRGPLTNEYENKITEDPKQMPVELKEQLSALKELIDCGKVRYFGVSNETPFGVCSMGALHQFFPDLYPKCVSIQNSYSLVCRKDYEAGNAEACYHYNVSLLPYSPLAGGTLSGKYRGAKVDEIDNNDTAAPRLTRFPGYMARYLGSENENAVNAYCTLAEKYNLTPTQLALSWCYHNELVSSTIIGATTMDQLTENLKSYDVKLLEIKGEGRGINNEDDEFGPSILDEISEIYKRYTDPTKAKLSPPKRK